jgi:hypothetical protein
VKGRTSRCTPQCRNCRRRSSGRATTNFHDLLWVGCWAGRAVKAVVDVDEWCIASVHLHKKSTEYPQDLPHKSRYPKSGFDIACCLDRSRERSPLRAVAMHRASSSSIVSTAANAASLPCQSGYRNRLCYVQIRKCLISSSLLGHDIQLLKHVVGMCNESFAFGFGVHVTVDLDSIGSLDYFDHDGLAELEVLLFAHGWI